MQKSPQVYFKDRELLAEIIEAQAPYQTFSSIMCELASEALKARKEKAGLIKKEVKKGGTIIIRRKQV